MDVWYCTSDTEGVGAEVINWVLVPFSVCANFSLQGSVAPRIFSSNAALSLVAIPSWALGVQCWQAGYVPVL